MSVVRAGGVARILSGLMLGAALSGCGSWKSRGRVLVVPLTDMAMLRMGVEGVMTAHLVDGGGRVLFSQTRIPGSHQQLLAEDLRAATASDTLAGRDPRGRGSFRG